MHFCEKKILCGFLFLVTAFLLFRKEGDAIDTEALAESIVQQMTDEQLAGQCMIIGLAGERFSEKIGFIIRTYSPGGIFLNGSNIAGRNLVKNFTDELQKASTAQGIGLFIATDQEGGTVNRVRDGMTLFPGNMGFGNINDSRLVYEAAAVTGYELRAIGINMNFAPCLDLADSDPRSIVNIRSYSHIPARVSDLGISCIKGLQKEANCIAVAKHFPGHGAVRFDSHLVLPVSTASIDELEKSGLVPFHDAMSRGLDAVMSAHISFRSIDSSGTPSSASSEFNRHILREKYRYQGLIITDDLSMEGMKSVYSEGRAAVEALSSGADMALVVSDAQVDAVYNAILAAIKSGALDRKSLRLSAQRIVKAKIRYRVIDAAGKSSMYYGKIDSDLYARKDLINAEVSVKSIFEYAGDNAMRPTPAIREQSIVVTDNGFLAGGLQNEKIPVASEKNAAEKIRELKAKGFVPRVYYVIDSISSEMFRQLRLQWINKEISLVLVLVRNPFPVIQMFPKDSVPPFICSFSPTERSLQAVIDSLSGKIRSASEIPELFWNLLPAANVPYMQKAQ